MNRARCDAGYGAPTRRGGSSGSGDDVTRQQTPDADPDRPAVYQIRLRGHLDQLWSDWFDGLAIAWRAGDTLLTGAVVDQAALHGLIRRTRDLGLPLLSINRVRAGDEPDRRNDHTNATNG